MSMALVLWKMRGLFEARPAKHQSNEIALNGLSMSRHGFYESIFRYLAMWFVPRLETSGEGSYHGVLILPL